MDEQQWRSVTANDRVQANGTDIDVAAAKRFAEPGRKVRRPGNGAGTKRRSGTHESPWVRGFARETTPGSSDMQQLSPARHQTTGRESQSFPQGEAVADFPALFGAPWLAAIGYTWSRAPRMDGQRPSLAERTRSRL